MGLCNKNQDIDKQVGGKNRIFEKLWLDHSHSLEIGVIGHMYKKSDRSKGDIKTLKQRNEIKPFL